MKPMIRNLVLLVIVTSARPVAWLLAGQLRLLNRLGHKLPAPRRRPSTKQCPACGDPCMVPLHSTNTKICPTCSTEIPWTLTGDQKPTHQPHRAQRKAIQE